MTRCWNFLLVALTTMGFFAGCMSAPDEETDIPNPAIVEADQEDDTKVAARTTARAVVRTQDSLLIHSQIREAQKRREQLEQRRSVVVSSSPIIVDTAPTSPNPGGNGGLNVSPPDPVDEMPPATEPAPGAEEVPAASATDPVLFPPLPTQAITLNADDWTIAYQPLENGNGGAATIQNLEGSIITDTYFSNGNSQLEITKNDGTKINAFYQNDGSSNETQTYTTGSLSKVRLLEKEQEIDNISHQEHWTSWVQYDDGSAKYFQLQQKKQASTSEGHLILPDGTQENFEGFSVSNGLLLHGNWQNPSDTLTYNATLYDNGSIEFAEIWIVDNQTYRFQWYFNQDFTGSGFLFYKNTEYRIEITGFGQGQIEGTDNETSNFVKINLSPP